MFIIEPSRVIAISEKEDGVLQEGMHYTFRIQRESIAESLKHIGKYPNDTQIDECSKYLAELTDLLWSRNQVRDLLALYPNARIRVAARGACKEASDDLNFAVAHFFLNTSWPTYGDNVDMVKFMNLLHKQAMLMGFDKAQ